jgi:hemolysin activation/secretion protein
MFLTMRQTMMRRVGQALVCLAALVIAAPSWADEAGRLHFDLTEIRVEGSTLLPEDQVEQAVYPFLGPDKTLQDVDHARAALQALYQSAGYATVSVTIPQQHVSQGGGVVRFAVIERPVGRLRVTGSRYFLPSDIRRAAPSLAPGTVPNMKRVTADLTALNGLPDRQVQPSLKAGRVPDTVDVDLAVTDTFPLHGTLEVNNRYNADTTSLRLAASLSYGNLFQRGDSASIGYQVAPEDVENAEVSSASYLFHVPRSQFSLLFSYLHSNSNVTALGTTDVAGRGTSAGFRVLIPLGSTSSFSHSLSLGWDYKKYYELDTFKTTKQVTSAPITYYPVSAAYLANWTGSRSSTDLSIGLEFGLGGLGSNELQFDNKAYDAHPGFSVAHAAITREQDLPYGAQAWASVTGQLTNEALVSSEQIGMGGADSVRGYLEAETLGDYGAYAQTELRSPSLAKYLGGPVSSWRFHVFYDGGIVDLNDAEVHQRSTYGLQSAGIGSRINLWGYLNGVLQDAHTLNRGADTKPGTNRVLFRVYGEF